ncbi:MAG TPA: DUF3500 domain-containing protein [Gammaproteobacteria bacterium]
MITRLLGIAVAALLAHASFAQEPARVSVSEELVRIANELLGTVEGGPGGTEQMLGVDRGRQLKLAFDDPNRENWQFWPAARVGLPIELMDGRQRHLLHELLTATLSAKGYLKTVHIMQLEQILDLVENSGLPRSVDHYVLVLFGTPSMEDVWGWRFEGHHVSLNFTVAPDAVSVTPSFFGSNPAEVRTGPLTGFRVHGEAEDLARELVLSLDERQRRVAIVSDVAPAEIFTGNIRKPREQWDAWKTTLEPQGIRVGELNESQQHWVRRILDEVVGNYRPEISEAYLRAIDPASLHFAWMGSTERGRPHYFRLQGEDFVFEYDNVQNDGNHVHSVWRSPSGDFGERLLEQHYQSSHRARP